MMFSLIVDDEVSLRYFWESDADTLLALTNHSREHLMQYINWPAKMHTREDALKDIRGSLRILAQGTALYLPIIYKGELAGAISLKMKDRPEHEAEIGYWLGAPYTGKGIVTRSTRALIDYAITHLNKRRIVIRCSPDNPASAAVPERLGFVREAFTPQKAKLHGQPLDLVVYSVLDDEWTVTSQATFSHRIDEHLELRLLERRHAAEYFRVQEANRAHIAVWEDWIDFSTSEADVLDFIEFTLERFGEGQGFAVGIYYRPESDSAWSLVGSATCERKNAHIAEIGYWLDANHTGLGIITRVGRALTTDAFKTGSQRVQIVAAAENQKSRAVAERLDYQLDAIKRQERYLRGKFIDRAVYSALKGEWG